MPVLNSPSISNWNFFLIAMSLYVGVGITLSTFKVISHLGNPNLFHPFYLHLGKSMLILNHDWEFVYSL